MDYNTSSSTEIQKGKWKNITPGKVPVKTSFLFTKRGKEYLMNRTQRVLPDKALSGDYEIDFARMEEEGIDFPNPDNLNRYHEHEGYEGAHKVGLKHKNLEVQSEHRDERDKYERQYYKAEQKHDAWEKANIKKKDQLELEQKRLLSKPKKSLKDKQRLKDVKKKLTEKEKVIVDLKKPELEPQSWLDKYNVQVKYDVKIKYRGQPIEADVYTLPRGKHKIYSFKDFLGRQYLYSDKFGKQKFERTDQAYAVLKKIFEDSKLRNSIILKSNDLERKSLMYKIEKFISSISPTVPINEENCKTQLFSEFKSGEDTVTLEGDNNQYKVSTNGVPSIVTECFQEAISKYYSSVSRIIQSQVENKDMGLELFGEHVLNTSRNTRRLLAEMDKSLEVSLLDSFDYSELQFPFNTDFVMKYEPQGDVFGIVPAPNESNVGEAEGGKTVSRKDLRNEDFEEYKNEEKNQKCIKETTNDSPGVDLTGANLITNSLNQHQLVETRQEENLQHNEIEKPIKVKNTYQQNLHPAENKVIEQRYGVN